MYQNATLFCKKTQFDFQKHDSISETQFNFTTTIFISHSLITQFNFQKHNSILRQQYSSFTKNHNSILENTNSHENSYENRKNDLILIMTPEKQDKTLELIKH